MNHIFKSTLFIVLFFFTMTSPDVQSQQNRARHGSDQNAYGQYERRIEELEKRIQELEAEKKEEKSISELDALLQDIDSVQNQSSDEDDSIKRVFRSDARQQQQLNPEISLTGDFSGSYTTGKEDYFNELGNFTTGRNKFFLREAQLNVVAPLDPFTRGKFFFSFPGTGGGDFAVEEAYMEWLNLPLGMNLKIGEFITQFGSLNRWHDHGLYQYDRPRALTNLFGTGNFGGIGFSANFLLPQLWAHVNELDIEVVSGGDGFSFDDSYENVIGVAHLKNYYDVTNESFFELGVSGAYGYNDKKNDLRTSLTGLDITYKWVPIGRSRYRTTEFKTEFYLSSREELSGSFDGFGFYSFVINKIGPRSWIGLRYSYSDMPPDPNAPNYSVLKDADEWDISPTFDFWQSEFVMIRLQYSFVKRSYAEDDNTLYIQTVWAMGPHKHEKY